MCIEKIYINIPSIAPELLIFPKQNLALRSSRVSANLFGASNTSLFAKPERVGAQPSPVPKAKLTQIQPSVATIHAAERDAG